jgi:hypothetical protein
MDRGTILQIRANRLPANGQAGPRQPERKRRGRLAAERGDTRIDELQVMWSDAARLSETTIVERRT